MLDTIDYHNKLINLLSDKNTYISTSLNTINNNIEIFINSYKKIISNEDKFCYTLINYLLIIPMIYGLLNTHKSNIPLHPIISGIGTAPHNIAKSIAKIFTSLLGTIRSSNLNNSDNFLNNLKNINV